MYILADRTHNFLDCIKTVAVSYELYSQIAKLRLLITRPNYNRTVAENEFE